MSSDGLLHDPHSLSSQSAYGTLYNNQKLTEDATALSTTWIAKDYTLGQKNIGVAPSFDQIAYGTRNYMDMRSYRKAGPPPPPMKFVHQSITKRSRVEWGGTEQFAPQAAQTLIMGNNILIRTGPVEALPVPLKKITEVWPSLAGLDEQGDIWFVLNPANNLIGEIQIRINFSYTQEGINVNPGDPARDYIKFPEFTGLRAIREIKWNYNGAHSQTVITREQACYEMALQTDEYVRGMKYITEGGCRSVSVPANAYPGMTHNTSKHTQVFQALDDALFGGTGFADNDVYSNENVVRGATGSSSEWYTDTTSTGAMGGTTPRPSHPSRTFVAPILSVPSLAKANSHMANSYGRSTRQEHVTLAEKYEMFIPTPGDTRLRVRTMVAIFAREEAVVHVPITMTTVYPMIVGSPIAGGEILTLQHDTNLAEATGPLSKLAAAGQTLDNILLYKTYNQKLTPGSKEANVDVTNASLQLLGASVSVKGCNYSKTDEANGEGWWRPGIVEKIPKWKVRQTALSLMPAWNISTHFNAARHFWRAVNTYSLLKDPTMNPVVSGYSSGGVSQSYWREYDGYDLIIRNPIVNASLELVGALHLDRVAAESLLAEDLNCRRRFNEFNASRTTLKLTPYGNDPEEAPEGMSMAKVKSLAVRCELDTELMQRVAPQDITLDLTLRTHSYQTSTAESQFHTLS